MAGEDLRHRIPDGVEPFLRHLLLRAVLRAQDISDAVVGNGPGVKEIVGTADDGPDPRFRIEIESHLGLQVFENIQEHALKPLVPEIGITLVLGDSTDRHFSSSHKHLLPFSNCLQTAA